MLALTTWTGGILVAVGVIAYIVSGAVSVTALIPAFFGVLLLIAALVARQWEAAHKHAMHAALLVALLGALGSLMNVVKIGDLFSGTAERPAAIITSIIMFVILVAYLVAGVRSFIAARSAQKS